MQFQTVKEAIKTLLATNAGGLFQVLGYQRQGVAASQRVTAKKTVAVFYHEGTFPQSSGSISGPNIHEATYALELMAAGAARGDVNDPITAIMAEVEADAELDSLFASVYQIIMDAQNRDLGLAIGATADRWIENMKKGPAEPKGEYVVVTGRALLTVRLEETVGGEALPADATDYQVTIDQIGDDVEQTGVAGTLGGS